MESTVHQFSRRNRKGTTSIVHEHQRHVDQHALANELAMILAGKHPQTGEDLSKQGPVTVKTGKPKAEKPARKKTTKEAPRAPEKVEQLSMFDTLPKPEPEAVKPKPEPEIVQPEPEITEPEPEEVNNKLEPESDREPGAQPGNDNARKPGGEREYFDVGEKIGGARKDLAMQFANGQKSFQNIDWDDMKANPGDAATFINKKNLIGHVTPEYMRELGMDAQAAWFVNAMFRVIDKAPKDSVDDRYRYAKACDRLVRALNNVKTASDAFYLVQDIAEEAQGAYGTPEMMENYNGLKLNYRMARDAEKEAREEYQKISRDARTKLHFATLTYFSKEQRAEFKEAGLLASAASTEYLHNVLNPLVKTMLKERDALSAERERIAEINKNDPYSWDQCYGALGDKFYAGLVVLGNHLSDIRVYTNDKRFDKTPTWITAEQRIKEIKPDDWTWTERGEKEQGEKSEIADTPITLPVWKREVPEEYDRTGGKVVDFGALSKNGKVLPEGLIKAFGLRGVEYGNWVTQAEAAHHTQRAGEALQDLATILDLDPEQVSYGGRLALAIGARGKGAQGGGAVAHYEPGKKVINMTKMLGGGSLAHEWGHFLDNIVGMVNSPKDAGHGKFLSTAALTGDDMIANADPDVLNAMNKLNAAMREGSHAGFTKVKPPKRGVSIRRDDEALLKELHKQYGAQKGLQKFYQATGLIEKLKANHFDQAAAARHWSRNVTDQDMTRDRLVDRATDAAQYMAILGKCITYAPDGEFHSGYSLTANVQDKLKRGAYYSDPAEMYARAFESYISDKGEERGIKNSYLVKGVKVPDHVTFEHPLTGEKIHFSTYPNGEERKAINSAMEGLIQTLKFTNTFQKAMRLLAKRKRAGAFQVMIPVGRRAR